MSMLCTFLSQVGSLSVSVVVGIINSIIMHNPSLDRSSHQHICPDVKDLNCLDKGFL